MQEVFEKIIGKLVNKRKTVEQLIMENPQDELDKIQTQAAEDFASAYGEAIEIVKQEAEKYNNGWIPCSERLPEECIEVLVSVKEIDDGFYTITSWVQDGVWVIKKTPLQPTVIAWQPLPQPYQPKGE